MQGITYPVNARAPSSSQPITGVATTLYDLMEAIQEEVQPGEEALAPHIVRRLMDRGRITFPENTTARSANALSSL